MKGFPLSSSISIWSCPFFFAVTKYPSATLIYLSVSTNDLGIKYKISVSCDKSHLSLKFNWSVARCLHSFFHGFLHWNKYVPYSHISYGTSFCLYVFWCLIYFLLSVRTSFRIFLVSVNVFILSVRFWTISMKWSSDPHLKRVFGFQPSHSLR